MNPFSRISYAEKFSVDQLKEALQNKTLPAYIAIPLIEEKMDMESRAQNMMAMQQAQQQQPPIAEEIMQRADAGSGGGEGGIDQLPTNLPPAAPTNMAGGGIVAFQEGGSTPVGRWWEQGIKPAINESVEDMKLRAQLFRKYGLAGTIPGLFMNQTPEERQSAKNVIEALPNLTRAEMQYISEQGPNALGTANLARDQNAQEEIHARVGAPTTMDTQPPPTPGPGEGLAQFNLQDISAYVPSATKAVKNILEGEDGYIKQSEAREKSLMAELDKNKIGGKAFHEYEKMLREEAVQTGIDKDKAKSMAIFKAGLAMMAGTHPNALVNIGQGAMVGAEDYQHAYEKLRQADRQRTKEFALIEEARRAEEKRDVDRRDDLLMKAFEIGQKRSDVVASALIQGGMADVNNAADMAKTLLAGGMQMQAAQIRHAAKAGTGSDKTIDKIAQEVRQSMPYDDAQRDEYAKFLKFSKTPPKGVNKEFDKGALDYYQNRVNDLAKITYDTQMGARSAILNPQQPAPNSGFTVFR